MFFVINFYKISHSYFKINSLILKYFLFKAVETICIINNERAFIVKKSEFTNFYFNDVQCIRNYYYLIYKYLFILFINNK